MPLIIDGRPCILHDLYLKFLDVQKEDLTSSSHIKYVSLLQNSVDFHQS